MTIDDFLKSRSMTAEELAGLADITPTSLSRIRRGQQNTTREVMQRIIAASGNLISAESLVHAGTDATSRGEASAGKASDLTAKMDALA